MFDSANNIPLALNINPKKYLKTPFSACQHLADEAPSLPSQQKELRLYKQHVDSLHQLACCTVSHNRYSEHGCNHEQEHSSGHTAFA